MSSQIIPIFFLTDCLYGGWRIYTAHLMRALRSAGLQPRIYKIGKRTEACTRKFHYGESYQNVNLEDAYRMARRGPSLISAFDKNYISEMIGLHACGAYMMIHDEDEIIKTVYGREYVYSALARLKDHRVLTNRYNGIHKDGATCILHPYDNTGLEVPMLSDIDQVKGWRLDRKLYCVSIARIDNDKRTEFLFDVNRLLKAAGSNREITIRGYDGRVYGRKFLKLHYPEYKMSSYEFPKDDLYAGAKICAEAEYSIDMSRITGEGGGGGTQYTFLESMHVGTPVVIHKDWLRPNGEMSVHNAIVVETPEEVAYLITRGVANHRYLELVQRGYDVLDNHDHRKIGKEFKKLFGKWSPRNDKA